jgi:hypothetical protein
MGAERMTPGAIREAIARTDGRAMYDPDVMQFYGVDSPAGVSQINHALRRYIEGREAEPAQLPAPARVNLGPPAEEDVLPPIRQRPMGVNFLSDAVDEFLENNHIDALMEMYREIGDQVEDLGDRTNQQTILRLIREYSDQLNEMGDGDAGLAGHELADRFRDMIIEASRPEGHATGGLIQSFKNGGDPVIPDIEYEEDKKPNRPFQPFAIPYATPGVSGARINRTFPIDQESAASFNADVSRSQNPSGTNYNVNEVGGGYHHKVGPGMLGITGSHRMGTKDNRINVMYALPMKNGGQPEVMSEFDKALNQPGLKHKFTEQDLLSNYGDSVVESFDKAKARKRLEPVALKHATYVENFDDGVSLLRRNSVPLGKANPEIEQSGKPMEDYNRQHMPLQKPSEQMNRGTPVYKKGGAAAHKPVYFAETPDAMRYELLRNK